MSKSLGNFLTLKFCTEKYGADATRLALAESGDTIDDANFTHESANSAILKLFTLYKWIEENLETLDSQRTGEFNFFDRLFNNELNYVIEKTRNAYENMLFRDVAKFCFFDLHAVREEYNRLAT